MGRRRRSKSSSYSEPDAVTTYPNTPLADRLFGLSAKPFDLTPIEDRRQYHPEDFYRPARLLSGVASPPVKVKVQKPFKVQMPFGLQFQVPEKTVVCVRRKRRKEVLHAMRKVGRGSKRKKPRRNWYSAISC